ncbi:Hypothetical protein SMAX5B_009091 [Scophthalmus maximus]|uniref:Uncharacterized protein n=1 Tax=Scophthalmus maximus TaxID=52904 RepID=A0A2U9CI01_SCOMX|nr:Hypothetical protein SMAX5B_009091 [Scophthalmus maximus]
MCSPVHPEQTVRIQPMIPQHFFSSRCGGVEWTTARLENRECVFCSGPARNRRKERPTPPRRKKGRLRLGQWRHRVAAMQRRALDSPLVKWCAQIQMCMLEEINSILQVG